MAATRWRVGPAASSDALGRLGRLVDDMIDATGLDEDQLVRELSGARTRCT